MCKPKVKKMNGFVRFITFGWAAGITLAPFGIYIQSKYFLWQSFKRIVNHEEIHWKQQLEMGILPFYIWYGLEWFIKLFIYGKKAYYNISFEREANAYENNFNYLETRKTWAWFKYIRIK